MGLFGSSEDTEAEQLADNAKGESLTAERLTAVERGFGKGKDYLSDGPVIDWLEDGEQPHFIFPTDDMVGHQIARQSGEDLQGEGKYRAIPLITDERILFIIGDESGDWSHIVEYDEITGVGYKINSEPTNSRGILSIETEEDTYIMKSIYIEDDMRRAADYLLNVTGAERKDVEDTIEYDVDEIVEAMKTNPSIEGVEDLPNELPDDVQEEVMKKADEENIATDEPKKEEEVKLGDDAKYLDDDEEVEYIIEGKSVEIEGGVDKETTSSSIGTRMKTVVTDDRILLVIPQRLKGTDTKTIIYDDVAGVDLKSGFVVKKLNIQSHTRTYDIHILDEDKAEEVVDYIRKKKKEANRATQQPQAGSSEPDPTEQLKNIKELHDQGVLSDEEFEEKKAELMDRI